MKSLANVRLQSEEFYQQNYYYNVAEAAQDQFSQPSTFRVRSSSQLGAVGSDVTLSLSISGYVKTNTWTDKQTGQPRSVPEPKVYFDASVATQQEIAVHQKVSEALKKAS